MDKSILISIAVCYQNKNPSQTLVRQELFHSLKLQEIVSGGVTFSLKHKTKVYFPELY